MMRAKLIVAAMFAIHVSAAVVQTYKDAYGSVWYMTAINPPQWNEKALVGYPVVDNGSAYVYRIDLSTTALSIPTALPWSSGGSAPDAHPSIEYLTREATANHPYLTTVSVNRSTELRAPYFRNCGALKEFTYEGFSSRDTGILQNSKYAVQGGVLYDGQLTDLKKYPEGKDGDVFTVPASVVSLHQFTLSNTKLKKIVFEGNAPKITRAYSGDTWQTVSNTVVSGSQNLSLICYRQGASGWGRYWCGIPAYAIPKAVTGLVASQGTSSRGVVLTWEANEVATRYAVYRADSATGTRAFVGETTWRASSYVDRTAIPRQEYAYWVVPWNEDVEGAVSGVVVGYADDPKFYFKEADGEAELVSCDCAGGPLEIPASSENGLPVTKIGRRAVSDAEGITSLTIPTAVRVVGARAFTGGSRLLSVAIPESVSQIGEYAFSGCALKQVDLPEAIETVADGVFFGCDALERVDLKSSVSKIGNDAFCGCRSLVSLAMPAGVKSIGNDAFYGCERLSEISIPDNLAAIGERAFHGCDRLADDGGFVIVRDVLYSYCGDSTTPTIPSNVTRIGMDAFKRNDLISVTIQEGVTSIGSGAFYGCDSLSVVTIPEGVTQMGRYAFEGCRALKRVKLPSSLKEVEEYAFDWCTSLESVDFGGGIEKIGDNAFSGCGVLLSVALPEGLKSIGDYAFDGCESLSAVTIPESVTRIGEGAFMECYRLADANGFVIVKGVLYDYDGRDVTEITIPEGVTRIGYCVFNCYSLTSVTIPESVTAIGPFAFNCCESLVSLTMPDHAIDIDETAFRGCTGLANAEGLVIVRDVLYGRVRVYGDDADGSVDLVIPEKVTRIGTNAFAEDYSLASVTVPESVTSIGPFAFGWCESLASVTMPDHEIDIDETAFRGCTGLADAEGFVIVRGVLYGREHCDDVSVDLAIPEKVARIGTGAFEEDCSLASVTVPNGVTGIGSNAFAYCEALVSITIPSSVTNVGEDAFVDCPNLTSVIVETGDAHRVKEMLAASGLNVSRIEFVARGTNPDSAKPLVVGDASAEVTGDADAGFVVKPSAGVVAVVVEIPNGVDAKNVRVVVGPDVKTVTPNGTAVRVVRGAADITDFLDIPAAVGGVIDLGAATVKPEVVSEALDAAKGAVVDLSSAESPSLTTAPTRKGLAYRLKEGATLGEMAADADGDSKVGDGAPWTPKVTVKGGASGFYSIRVSK